MGLSFGSSGSSQGYMGNGIFIDEVIIENAVDLSGKTTEFWQRPYALAIEANIVFVKNDWRRRLSIGGNFKRDEQTGEVTGWGGAFMVRDFLIRTGVAGADMELDDNNQIPAELIEKLRGKSFLLLSYRNSKGKSSNWNQIGSIDADKKELKAAFLKEWQRTGYPKNYSPDNGATQPAPEQIVGAEEVEVL